MEMTYAFSRLRVAATAAIVPRLNIPTPLTFVGADSSLSLGQMIAGSGLKRIMVVTDARLMSLGLADRLLQALRRRASRSTSSARSCLTRGTSSC